MNNTRFDYDFCASKYAQYVEAVEKAGFKHGQPMPITIRETLAEVQGLAGTARLFLLMSKNDCIPDELAHRYSLAVDNAVIALQSLQS